MYSVYIILNRNSKRIMKIYAFSIIILLLIITYLICKLNLYSVPNFKFLKWGVIAGFGAFASFVIGVIDGWMNPKKCNG